MKIVLKRRKHRNGVRPTRKGSIKINLQDLPNVDSGLKGWSMITEMLIAHGLTNWGDEFPKGNASAAEWRRYHTNFERRKQNLFYIRNLQNMTLFLHNNKQVKPIDLALRAINEVNPVFVGKRKSACDTCERKSNCPFSAVPKHLLEYACPIIQQFRCNMTMKAVRDEPTDTPLTQPEMANLALTHLS